MKVVFLDIDGVLNSQRSCIAFGGFPHNPTGPERQMFDEVAVRLVAGIVRAAGAKVVLSSTWRKHDNWTEIGPALGLPIIDRTPCSWKGRRGLEIAEWLAAHPEVESYAIVDDDSDMLPEQLPFFVHTSGFDGLSWSNAKRLAELLGIDLYDVNHPKNKAGNGEGFMA